MTNLVSRRLSGTAMVWLLSSAIVAVSGVLYVAFVRNLQPLETPVTLPWWLLAGLFFAAESYIVHIEFRGHAHSFSLSEVPWVLGLFFVAPTTLLLAQLAGAAPAFLRRRQSADKLAFNLANISLEVVVSLIVFHTLVKLESPLGPTHWVATFAAVLPAVVLGIVLINSAIQLSGGKLQQSAWSQVVVFGGAASLTNTSLALVGVTLLWTDALAGWLLLAPLGMLVFAYRAYTTQRQKHESLEFLYEATRVAHGSLELDSGAQALLSKCREMFRAEVSEITFFPTSADGSALHTRLGPGQEFSVRQAVDLDPTEGVWARVASEDKAVLLSKPIANERLRRHFEARGITDAMIAPIHSANGVAGTILVGNRLGDVAAFGAEDLRLFETVANHASVSIENARLVEHLSSSLVQLQELNEENHYQATHDALTGLPNRALFHDRVEQAAAAARREDSQVAVMILDLDRFKEVNDTLGHQNGDILIQQIGTRLQDVLREVDTVARFGGDEFAIALHGVSGAVAAAGVARKLLAALEKPFFVCGLSLAMEASIGIAMFPTHGDDVHSLIQRADVAMYVAKEHHSGVELYSPQHDPHSADRLSLIAELRRALDDKQFVLHYQPKADLRTGAIVGVEALVRWQHPQHGLVFPDQFVPVAEDTGLIKPLTLYVLDAALQQQREWSESGLDLKVAVNLSAKNLIDLQFADEVADLLDWWRVPSEALELEITESTIMADPVRAMNVLSRLSAMGIGLAIDDFGTGYSSLGYLKRLPVNEIKVDKSFVLNMTKDSSDAAIVRSTIELGRNLGLRVVAEGVENEEVWRLLRDLGSHQAQGYHISRPLPPESLQLWILERATPALEEFLT